MPAQVHSTREAFTTLLPSITVSWELDCSAVCPSAAETAEAEVPPCSSRAIKTAVGDGHAMGVAGQIGEHRWDPAKGRLASTTQSIWRSGFKNAANASAFSSAWGSPKNCKSPARWAAASFSQRCTACLAPFDEQWTLFAIPTLRFYGESGADSGDSATGGALAGVSYRVNDRLTIGPGLGVLSQIEDSVSIFPILIVDWKITDRISLETGRGLGATQGPGLNLNYRLSDTWSFGLGGRYESLRFRLDDRGSAPDGVGEDRSVPVYLSATYSRGRDLQISAIGGVELNGELRLEDSQGRRLARDNYESAPFLGATFNVRF